MRPLTEDDFPLYAIGPLVYGKTRSSLILTANDDAMAADICSRLNYSDIAGAPYSEQSGRPIAFNGDPPQVFFVSGDRMNIPATAALVTLRDHLKMSLKSNAKGYLLPPENIDLVLSELEALLAYVRPHHL